MKKEEKISQVLVKWEIIFMCALYCAHLVFIVYCRAPTASVKPWSLKHYYCSLIALKIPTVHVSVPFLTALNLSGKGHIPWFEKYRCLDIYSLSAVSCCMRKIRVHLFDLSWITMSPWWTKIHTRCENIQQQKNLLELLKCIFFLNRISQNAERFMQSHNCQTVTLKNSLSLCCWNKYPGKARGCSTNTCFIKYFIE